MNYDKEIKLQSPLEYRFMEDCITVGLRVEPQYKIGPIHADFAVVDAKVAIECDSKKWHAGEEARANDDRRNEIYLAHGWKVVRIFGSGVYKCGENIAQKIKNMIAKGEFEDVSIMWIAEVEDEDLEEETE